MTQPIRHVRPSQIDPVRLRLYQRAIWIAVLGNVTLVLAKGAAAWLSGSTALLATAVDSASDLVYTLFMAWGLSRSQQPADESHPQGHARIEPVVSAVIALMMGLAGLEVVRQAIDRLRGQPATFAWGLPAAVLIGSALVKVIMYLAVRRLGQKAHSPAIMASAKDNLADVISAGTALAGVLAASWVHPLADPVAGLAVSVWIFRNAAGILVENLGYLTGRAAAARGGGADLCGGPPGGGRAGRAPGDRRLCRATGAGRAPRRGGRRDLFSRRPPDQQRRTRCGGSAGRGGSRLCTPGASAAAGGRITMIVEGSSAPARCVAKAMAQALQREKFRLNARVAVSVQIDPAGPEP